MKYWRLSLSLSSTGFWILVALWGLGFGFCEGNVGDTPEQIKARYGAVVYKFEGTAGTFRFRRPGVETDTVDVAFQGGKSQWESYHHWKSKALVDIDNTGTFFKADIDAVLKANARGLTWFKQAPNPNELPGATVWLLGSNDPKSALAKAVANNEQHSLALWLSTYSTDGQVDAATAAKLDVLFPAPAKTPEPVRSVVPLKSGAFPALRILGQTQSTVNKILGEPSNRWPIHKPDKYDGGVEVEYPDSSNWTLLHTAFYRDQLRWFDFFFTKPLPESADELFKVLELPKSEFQVSSETADATKYRGVVDKRLIEIVARHPTPLDGVGFCHVVDVELVETLR